VPLGDQDGHTRRLDRRVNEEARGREKKIRSFESKPTVGLKELIGLEPKNLSPGQQEKKKH